MDQTRRAMGDPADNDSEQRDSDQELLPRPDLRQSLCHTMLASAFVLLGVFNPFARGTEAVFHSWMMVVLAVVVALSWVHLAHRLERWRGMPPELRERSARSAEELRQRAVSHLLMGLLALLLTGFSLVGTLKREQLGLERAEGREWLPWVAALVGAGSLAILAAAARDLLERKK